MSKADDFSDAVESMTEINAYCRETEQVLGNDDLTDQQKLAKVASIVIEISRIAKEWHY